MHLSPSRTPKTLQRQQSLGPKQEKDSWTTSPDVGQTGTRSNHGDKSCLWRCTCLHLVADVTVFFSSSSQHMDLSLSWIRLHCVLSLSKCCLEKEKPMLLYKCDSTSKMVLSLTKRHCGRPEELWQQKNRKWKGGSNRKTNSDSLCLLFHYISIFEKLILDPSITPQVVWVVVK